MPVVLAALVVTALLVLLSVPVVLAALVVTALLVLLSVPVVLYSSPQIFLKCSLGLSPFYNILQALFQENEFYPRRIGLQKKEVAKML